MIVVKDFKLTVAREHLFLEQQARHQKYIERDITFLKMTR